MTAPAQEPCALFEDSTGEDAGPDRPRRMQVSLNKVGLVAAGAAAAGALVVGGSALADAATEASSGTTANGYGYTGNGRGPGGPGGEGGSADTPVTGDEAAKVTAAVKAKDSAVTVTSVRKDPDGSYDVLGTKNGSPVMFDVSKELATITQNTFAGGHGGRGPGGGAPGGNGNGGNGGTNPEASPSSTT
jgi:hypothetical protein